MSYHYGHSISIDGHFETTNTLQLTEAKDISEMYPNEVIIDKWAGDYWASSRGTIKYKNGEVIESTYIPCMLIETSVSYSDVTSDQYVFVGIGDDVPEDAPMEEILAKALELHAKYIREGVFPIHHAYTKDFHDETTESSGSNATISSDEDSSTGDLIPFDDAEF